MEKTFTLNDLQYYFQEIKQVENGAHSKSHQKQGPGNLVVQNILRYSSALNVLKSKKVGTFYQLAN